MRAARLAAIALFLALGLWLPPLAPQPAAAASALEIDVAVVAALTRFDHEIPAAGALLARPRASWCFPR